MKAMGVTYSPLFLTLRYFFSCVLATIYHGFDNGKLFQAPYPCSMLISAFSRSAEIQDKEEIAGRYLDSQIWARGLRTL